MSNKSLKQLAFLILLISIPGCAFTHGNGLAFDIWMVLIVAAVLIFIFAKLRD